MQIPKPTFSKIAMAAIALLLVSCIETFAQSTIYVGGHFRRERDHTINDLKASGFSSVILFNINVDVNGNLQMDGDPICTNGVYTFNSTNPNYINDVSALKSGNTSINWIETCVGGWGAESYIHIKDLINSQGTGSNTNLYRNFKALKEALPWIDAINNDDEHGYDVNTATAFHTMLADIGFKTTLAPYTNKSYWEQLANNLNSQRPGALSRVYIQCYDGGAGNNPCDWHIGGVPLHAGMLHFNSAATIRNQMNSWKNGCGVTGGFLWVYNANDFNLQEYAGTINSVFNSNPTDQPVSVYQDCNFGGYGVGLAEGSYNMGDLQAKGIINDDISSIKVKAGYKVTLYWDANFTGNTLVKTSDDGCLVDDGWNDETTSLVITKTSNNSTVQIEAEHYSSMSGVQIEACNEGGENVGYIESGDWMAYPAVNFPVSGTYLIEYRIASETGGGQISADINAGATVLGTANVPNTGGWQNWATVSHTVNVNAGTYPFGIYAVAGGWNLNWIKITAQGSAAKIAFDSHEINHSAIVYPNPFNSGIRLNFGAEKATIKVSNMAGQEVYSASSVRPNDEINLSELDKGVYILQIKANGYTKTERLIKK